MAFDGSKFARLSGHDRPDIPKEYAYYTNDTLATVLGASYFDSLVDDTRIAEGDTIYCRYDVDGTPGVVRLYVTDIHATTFVLTVTPEYLEGSATLDAGSIADGDEEVAEITVTGAALGDFCVASHSIDVADLGITAAVTATNTVTLQLWNNTGGAIDLASGTVRVRVYKRITF